MNKYSFDIKNSKDFFKKLEDDYEEFSTQEVSSRIALNCAMTAWHLSEWIYNEYKETEFNEFRRMTDFHNHIKSECPSLQIMQDLSNGTKHSKITMYNSEIQNTEKYEGTFDYTFDFTFDRSSLDIQLSNGTKTEFSIEIKECIKYYKKMFENL